MSAKAVLLCVAAIACWGLSAMFDKLAVSQIPARATFLARLYLIFILMLAPMVLGWDESRTAVLRGGRGVIFALVGSVVFTVSGLYVYYHALAEADASRVVALCATYPLVTYALALAFLKEPFTASGLAGIVLVVSGTALLVRR